MAKAAFCGSFDPITIGHVRLVERAAPLFEELIVFVSVNSSKREDWTLAQRKEWASEALSHLKNVRVESQDGLSAEACRKAGASVLIRGIRNGIDADYENNMAWMNRKVDPGLETLCLFSEPEYANISSSNVRELLKYHISIESLVPACVFESLQPDLASNRL